VREADPNEIVFIGASRIQLALDTAVFVESLGRPAVQLAVNGSSCLPVLDHLSRSEFRGTVVCDVSPNVFFGGMDWHGGTAAEYVRLYENRTAVDLLEARLRFWVQTQTVLGLPELAPRHLIGSALRGEAPEPWYITRLPDRSVRADYRRTDVAALAEYREQVTREEFRGVDADCLDRDLRDLEEAVARIQGRGGRVVFLMMPVSGVIREIEDERFPRARYWDVLVARTKAVTIHYADYPSMQFTCPEGSHLDLRDSPAFTRALVDVLRQKLGESTAVGAASARSMCELSVFRPGKTKTCPSAARPQQTSYETACGRPSRRKPLQPQDRWDAGADAADPVNL
jgi:hypothetical protein